MSLSDPRTTVKVETIWIRGRMTHKKGAQKIYWPHASVEISTLYLSLYVHMYKNVLFQQAKYRESVTGSVIQATVTVKFEDGLRTGVLRGGC